MNYVIVSLQALMGSFLAKLPKKKNIYNIMNNKILQRHPYHLVDPSPWPLLAAFGALFMTMGGVMYMHNYGGGGFCLITGFSLVLLNMYTWWRDIVREAAFEGQHTHMVQMYERWYVIVYCIRSNVLLCIFLGIFPF